MYSLILDGKVLDFRYKKHSGCGTAFYVGDILAGLVYNNGKLGWSVVCVGDCQMRTASGFKTRYAASEFILQSKGLQSP